MIINPYAYGGGGGGGTPSDIANIWDWWEPSREGLANNDPISTLTGQFAAKNFTQVGSARPTFKDNILNGLGVAEFNSASAQSLVGADASGLTAGHLWLVLLVNSEAGGTNNCPWFIGTDGTNPDLWPWTDNQIYMGAGRTSRVSTGVDPGPSLTTWRVLEVVTTSSEYTLKLDGSQFYTTGTNTVGFRVQIWLGAGPSGGLLAGQEAGCYFFSAKMSAGERTSMVNYLNSRFALSIV